MTTILLPAVVLAGDRLPRGKIALGPAGIVHGTTLLPWSAVRRVGGKDQETDFRPVRGAAGAALFGVAASVFAGPVGIAAAVALGATGGLRTRETFDVAFDDGTFLTVRAKGGTAAKVADWHAAARAAVPMEPPALLPNSRKWLPRKK